MAPTLLKDTVGSVTAFIERASDGSAAIGLVASDVIADLKKAGASSFSSISLVDPESATADIGSGGNGTVTTTVDAVGVGGNLYTVEVTEPAGTSGLSATLVGTVLTVALAVIGGAADAVQNTATLIAAAISLEAGITAAPSGTGADSIGAAEGPTTFADGLDGNFREFSNGFYEIDLTATETNTAGSLDIRWAGAAIRTGLITAFVASVAPANPIATQPPPTSTLFGFIYDPQGSPVQDAAVSARVLSIPTVLHPATEGMALSTGLVTATTDADGYFILTMIAGAQIDLYIPAAGFRRTLTVPALATNIFDLP